MGDVLDVGALIDSRPIGRAQWTVIGLCALVAMLDAEGTPASQEIVVAP